MIIPAEYGIVGLNNFRPFIIHWTGPIHCSKHTINIAFKRYSAGEYLLLHDT
jgi:hypothetical protein